MSGTFLIRSLLFLSKWVQSGPLLNNGEKTFQDSNELNSYGAGDLDGDYFQGGIRLKSKQEDMFLNKSGTFSSGLIDENYRWR